MLPGLRLLLLAIAATIVCVVLGFAQLVKLQVAQSEAVSLAPVEARFAGLAFAARADWIPEAASRAGSIEALPPFAGAPSRRLRLGHAVLETGELAKIAALAPAEAAIDATRLATDVPLTQVAALVLPLAEAPPAAPASASMAAPLLAPIEPVPIDPVAPEVVIGMTEPDAAPSAIGDPVPMPAPRPAENAQPQSKAGGPAAKKKATRTAAARRAAPAKGPQPAAAPRASDPFSALFGGSNSAGTARN